MIGSSLRTVRAPAWPRLLLAALAATAVAGCREEPSRFDQVQQETRGKRATAQDSIPGSEFNQFFPKSEGDYSVTYTQEKAGFAEADVSRSGEVVATLAVSDTANNPDAKNKFLESTATLDRYPMAAVGSQGTAVLVGDRVQIQVRSKDANLDAAGREEWVRKFDLANLGALARRQ